MAKKLACRLGRHEWTTRVEEGETFKVCAACGKTPPDSGWPAAVTEQPVTSGFDAAGGGGPGGGVGTGGDGGAGAG